MPLVRRLAVLLLVLRVVCVPLVAQEAGAYPEAQAEIRRILIHYDPDLSRELYPVHRDLIRSLPPEVSFVVGIERPGYEDVARFALEGAGLAPWRMEVVVARDPALTAWARDRLVVVQEAQGRRLVSPDARRVDEDRRGDATLALEIVPRWSGTAYERANLVFEGGNLLFTGERALAGLSLLHENAGLGQQGEGALRREFRRLMGCDLLLVETEGSNPHDHLDMFLTVVGRRRVLLGDPGRGADHLIELQRLGADRSLAPEWDHWMVQTQRELVPVYDRIRHQLEHAGYEVHRIPIVHGEGGEVLTWNNALLERRRDGLHAYLPSYDIPVLDEEAARVYRRLGFTVHPIDVSRVAAYGGTVRCLTNVLEWRMPAPARTPLRIAAVPAPR